MKRFIDPSARPAMTGRYREGQTRDAHTRLPNPELWREQELTPEQKAALESWGSPNETLGDVIRFEDCVDPSIPPGHVRIDGKLVRWPEVVFIPEGE